MTDNKQPPESFDHAKWVHEIQREDAHRAHDNHGRFFTETNKAAIDAGQVALRTAILVNGGAAVSILTFIGGLVGQGKLNVSQLHDMASVLIWFALGVGLALASLACSYFTNYALVEHTSSEIKIWTHPYISDGKSTQTWRWVSFVCRLISIATGLSSLVLFLIGMYAVRDAILLLK